MSDVDFLQFEIRLLVAHYGRQRVLEVFARLNDMTLTELEQQLKRTEARAKTRNHNRRRPLAELVATLPITDDARKNVIEELARLYESKRFLPNLRDVQECFRRRALPSPTHKSRRDALPSVLKALATLPMEELRKLAEDSDRPPEESDYGLLANAIMGKG